LTYGKIQKKSNQTILVEKAAVSRKYAGGVNAKAVDGHRDRVTELVSAIRSLLRLKKAFGMVSN
jgi:hypothetical protein